MPSAAPSCCATTARPQLASPSILASAGVPSAQGSRSRSGTPAPNRPPSSCANQWPLMLETSLIDNDDSLKGPCAHVCASLHRKQLPHILNPVCVCNTCPRAAQPLFWLRVIHMHSTQLLLLCTHGRVSWDSKLPAMGGSLLISLDAWPWLCKSRRSSAHSVPAARLGGTPREYHSHGQGTGARVLG